jgi:ABC-type branched-subunit amino acid transport system substrate-binding protein
MISAPNHQQPLNGNKFLAYLLLPILLISCGAFKKSQKTEWPEDDEIEVANISDDEPDKPISVTNVIKEKNEVKLVYSNVLFKGEPYKVPVHKKNFEIAVLLPFHSDASNSSSDKRRSNFMLEYYQGMKLAMKEAEKLGSKFKIHFYDTDNDTTTLINILKNPELEKMDIIIGPTDKAQVKIAAYFARKRQIPLFSPITSMTSAWSNNPYIFNLNPSDQMQAREFLNYYKKHHKDEQLFLIRDGQYFDKNFGTALIAECKAQKVTVRSIPYNRSLKWSAYLGDTRAVIVHTSDNKTNVNFSVTSLLSMAPNVTLVGPDKWLDFSSVDYSQWERLNITFIGKDKAQLQNDKSKEMVSKYRLLYNDDPSWYTYMGYDHLLFSCEVLNAFGEYFPLFIEGKDLAYTNTNIKLKKEGNCFQNQYVTILQLRDSKLIDVTQL